jgi:hypothetical protein
MNTDLPEDDIYFVSTINVNRCDGAIRGEKLMDLPCTGLHLEVTEFDLDVCPLFPSSVIVGSQVIQTATTHISSPI